MLQLPTLCNCYITHDGNCITKNRLIIGFIALINVLSFRMKNMAVIESSKHVKIVLHL